jgi:hypothetical protein
MGMKQPDISNWPADLERLTGMLLFAQLWDEMLFDYTLDSYRARRFNILGLCSELIDTYESYENDILSVRSITPIRDELLDMLTKDRIAKEILGTELPVLQRVLNDWNPVKPNKRITYAAASILKTVEPLMQKRFIEELETAVSDPHRKEDIIDLSGRLLTEVLRKGYSPSYVYFSVQNQFFRRRSIKGFQDLESFLGLFDSDDKKYEVVFKMDSNAKLLVQNANPDFLQYADKREAKVPAMPFESDFLNKTADEIFIVAPNIDARDQFAAVREAESRLALTWTLVGFLIHKVQMGLEKEALVYEGEPPTRVYTVVPPVRPTFKRPDFPDDAFDKPLVELVEAATSPNIDPKTASRIAGALRAHIVGVHAGISENQFSNLWTALETIASPSLDRNTIDVMLKRLAPVLCLKYFLKLINDLRNDIRNCIRPAFDRCLQQRKADETEIEFLVRILSQPECEAVRDDLYRACQSNPLLRYRIFRFHELLGSPKLALKLLNEHEQRVTWHIQRLYRARNTVIHAGAGYELIDLLTENVHEYFDHTLSEITDRIKNDRLDVSIEKVFSQYEWEYEAYKKALESLVDQVWSLRTARVIVFGI